MDVKGGDIATINLIILVTIKQTMILRSSKKKKGFKFL